MQHKMKHSSTCLYIGIMTIILIIIIIIWLCSVSVRTSISTLQICWIYVKKHHITKVSIENSWLTFLEDTNVRGAMFFRDCKEHEQKLSFTMLRNDSSHCKPRLLWGTCMRGASNLARPSSTFPLPYLTSKMRTYRETYTSGDKVWNPSFQWHK